MIIRLAYAVLLMLTCDLYGQLPKSAYEEVASDYFRLYDDRDWGALLDTFHPEYHQNTVNNLLPYLQGEPPEQLEFRFGLSSIEEIKQADPRYVLLRDLNWSYNGFGENAFKTYQVEVLDTRFTTNFISEGLQATRLTALCRSLTDPKREPWVFNFHFKIHEGKPRILSWNNDTNDDDWTPTEVRTLVESKNAPKQFEQSLTDEKNITQHEP